MGFAIANQLSEAGAIVHLVAGPVNLATPHNKIIRTDVTTAQQMFDACMNIFPKCNGAILSAAVADFRVEDVASLKIKKDKNKEELELKLIKNPDILATLGKLKKKKQVLMGFSLETHNAKKFALQKMKDKNCDCIVLNSLQTKGAGFGFDTNQVTILANDGTQKKFSLKTKKEVATDIVEFLTTKYF